MLECRTTWLLIGFTCIAGLPRAQSADPLLELSVGGTSYVGKTLAHDKRICWLAERDGRLTELELAQVTGFRKVEDRFRSLSAVDLRSQLRKEYGRGWDIVGTGHYLVCGPAGRAAEMGEHFEQLYRSFRSYFSRRSFNLPEPEFPMVAIVFATEREFADYCRADQVPYVQGLKGYYSRLTNRIALFEPKSAPVVSVDTPLGGLENTRLALGGIGSGPVGGDPGWARGRWDASVQADLKDTIVHEATHQSAYNLGLHSRIGQNPKWITEGLATMFEAEGTRENTAGKRPIERVNRERLEWFRELTRKPSGPERLARLVADDAMFQSQTLDAYAQAWALTFFLAETRSAEYSKYLKTVSDRPPLEPYTDSQRLTDFQAAFGKDLDRLDVSFRRFIDDLE
jgi:hypothetical protein